jgi:hypothetical protein
MNAAARIISNTRIFDLGLMQLTRHKFHSLDVAERVKFRTAALIYISLPSRLSARVLGQPVQPYIS